MSDAMISLPAVHAFFQEFCADFASFDGKRIARRYAIPCLSLAADGTLRPFTDAAALATTFQSHLDDYHAQGCRYCRYDDLQLMPTGTQSAVAAVSWQLLSEAGGVLRAWRESYGVMKAADGLRIYFSTDHAT